MANNHNQKYITDLVKNSQRILVLPSSPPDGDSIGSAIALYLVLKKLGKEATVVCSDPIPEVLQFLPHCDVVKNKVVTSSDFILTLDCLPDQITSVKSSIENNKVNIIFTPKDDFKLTQKHFAFNKGELKYDLIITVDCAELPQLRKVYEHNTELFHQVPVINIDHHISNQHYGKINHIDIMASSTTEMLLPILEELSRMFGQKLIDEDIATLLLTGIITDTGSFQNANTTPKSFEVASQLVAYGARQQEIIHYIYKTKQLSQLKLWGRILSKIQIDERHKMVWSVVTQRDFRDTGSSEEEIGDVIDELMTNAPGAEVFLLLKELQNGTIGGSLRTSKAVVDASFIASQFGGGGHTQAAGFRIDNMDMHQAEYKVVETIKNYQNKRLKLNQTSQTEEKNHQDFLEKIDQMNKEIVVSKEPEPEKPEVIQAPQASFEIPKAPLNKGDKPDGTIYKFEN
jgi:phosphoesterase RecJ-like protein